jgi:hypothetical protein
VSSQKRQGSVS